MSDRWEFYRRAVEKLGFRQKAYQQAFGISGSPANLALIDLGVACCAFTDDPLDLTDAQLREQHGMRRAFFRIWKNLNLSPQEMELVARQTLLRAVDRQVIQQGEQS